MQPQIAIVAASYIDSKQRFESAKSAFKSLRDAVSAAYELFVVDDVPRWGERMPKSLLPNYKVFGLGKNLYSQDHTHLKRRYRRGSRSALVEAVIMAEKAGYDHVFIHLDDNVYLPVLGELLQHAEDAVQKNNELKIVKFVGYPLLTHKTDLALGNRTFLEQEKDELYFDQYVFSPQREREYTLWQAELRADMVAGAFWPIGLWSAVYATTYLKKILLSDKARNCLHLAQVEMIYRDSRTWQDFISENPGSIGFINMQFCGFETEKNENWSLLIQSPNEAIY